MRKRGYYTKNHPSLWKDKEKIEKEKKSFKKTVIFLVILTASIFAVILIIYWLFFSPFFQVKKIIITGIDQADEIGQIQNITQNFLAHKRFLILSQKNVFFISRRALGELIQKKFDLKDVKIETSLAKKTLKIEIKPKFPALIWKAGENYFTVYDDGIIKDKISSPAKYGLPTASRGTTTEVAIGEQIISKGQMAYVKKLFELFNFYFKNIDIRQFVLTDLESRQVKLITSEGWQIIFSLDLNPQSSLEAAKAVLEQKIGERSKLQYIDARLKNRIYYK